MHLEGRPYMLTLASHIRISINALILHIRHDMTCMYTKSQLMYTMITVEYK